MRVCLWLFWIFSYAPLNFCDPQAQALFQPYDLLFDNAVEAYYKHDWLAVILNMEKALRNKGALRRIQTHCRLSCADNTGFGEPFPGLGVPIPGSGAVQDLAFFQRILKRADCVNACESEKLGPATLHKVSESVELEFKKRTPYNYLQVAYFKINKLDKAVAAANTFFMANPGHVEMKQNLEYYRMMAGVQEADFKDLEEREHMAEYLKGKIHYSMEDFVPAIEHFEAAVEEYFTAYEECRVLCEGAFNYENYMEYNADLFQSMTDHYLHVLSCKQNCAVELASTEGRESPFEDFLPSHFNHLQFSYYNMEKLAEAIECAKTFLLFHPEDDVMVQNLAYYSAVLGEEKALNITAREVVRQHIKRSLLEKELLYFGYEMFGKTFVDPDTWTPEEVMPKKLREKQKVDRETAARISEEIGNLMKEIETLVEEKSKESSDIAKIVNDEVKPTPTPETVSKLPVDDFTVTMTSKTLGGSQRVVIDGISTSEECQELHRLSGETGLQDVFKATPSSHSETELFQDIPLLKAQQEGLIPAESTHLFTRLSGKVGKALEAHFGLESPLYCSSSNLVCRSTSGKQKNDGACLLVSELNECIKEPLSSSDQGYRAILFLNEDFEGGDFIFSELDGKTVSAAVKPRCGRVVGFRAGQETLHGVSAVTKGKRCALEDLQAQEIPQTLGSPVEVDVQKTELNSKDKHSEAKRSIPSKTTEKEEVTMSTTSKTPEDVVKKSTKAKPKERKNPSKPTETQTKVKADKTKSTSADKKKAKNSNETKPATDKTTTSKKTKSKTSKTKDNTVEKHKEEL
ncbi:hypothetical protein DNTS_008622 [Danionella cerebrum]|uniref:Prolyl 4-hydroxylase alpha subunit domain-containing protein n=1 Tax=Danionella cerebrum TaxID=2873325 RepID=A0A553QT55_9TELE|nr:hypothetical protein DNTS_008622 [Danionella translucida]